MQVLKETKPKAKKQHRCMFCNGIIEIGETYNRQTIVADGSIYDFIYHKHCGELSHMLDMYDDCLDEGINDNDFKCYLDDYVYDNHKGEKEWKEANPPELAKMIYEEMKIRRDKMNVFTPYKSPLDCAKALWNDKLRYNKQCIEVIQIIRAIDGAKAWRNHPVCLMYKEHKKWLEYYLKLFELYKALKNSRKDYEAQSYYYLELDKYEKCANRITPSFINEEMCIQHRKRLYTKVLRNTHNSQSTAQAK